MAMEGKLRRAGAAGVAVVALIFCGGGARPAFEGDGYGGRLALAAARAAVVTHPDELFDAEFDLRHAAVAPYDADRDGVLSFAEWLERALAPYLMDDTDGDGRLSRQEYTEPTTRRRSLAPTTLADIFRELDRNHDGYVSVGDLARREAAPFRELDGNGDGKLSDDEIGTTTPIVSQPQAAVADLIGMTPNQLRERFGLPPADRDFVRKAHIDGTTLVTLIDVGSGRGACTNHGFGLLGDARGRQTRLEFEFRDGRLAEVRADARRGQSSVVNLALRCAQGTSRDDFDPITFAIAAPFMPVLFSLEAKYKARSREAASAIAAFRLGEPPPGGLAAYTASPPPQVTVVSMGEGAAQIDIKVKQSGFEAKVSVRDGLVKAIVPPFLNSCVFGDDRAFHC